MNDETKKALGAAILQQEVSVTSKGNDNPAVKPDKNLIFLSFARNELDVFSSLTEEVAALLIQKKKSETSLLSRLIHSLSME